MHHQRFTGLQPRPMPQRDMRGAEDHRKRCAVFKRHRRRHGHATPGVDQRLFGVTTMTGHADHPIPDCDSGHTLAEFQHFTRDFKAGAERRLRLSLILAASDQAIGEVDAAGSHFHPYLTRSGMRFRHIHQP